MFIYLFFRNHKTNSDEQDFFFVIKKIRQKKKNAHFSIRVEKEGG